MRYDWFGVGLIIGGSKQGNYSTCLLELLDWVLCTAEEVDDIRNNDVVKYIWECSLVDEGR